MDEREQRARRGWVVAGVAAAVFVALVIVAQLQRGRDDDAVARSTSTSSVPAASQPVEMPDATAVQPGDQGSTPAEPPASTSPEPDPTPVAEEGATGPRAGELFVVRRAPADPLAIGDVDAPVVLVEYLDLRCPFCALFSRDTLPTLIDEYVDAGLVRYEVHLVDFFGPQSADGAVAVLAAGEQGLAMEYLEAVYAAAPDRGHADLTREVLIGFAEQVGVADLDRFDDALSRAGLHDAVAEETAVAASLAINTVPFFLVNDLAIVGAQPIDVFREVLDDAVAAASN